jgi:hypothetical protein
MQYRSPDRWLFYCPKRKGATFMYAKLDKLREDLKKAVAKRDAAEAKVKRLEEKLREEENQQIVSDVASYNLTPEQLAQFLQLASSGKLQAMISGQIPMPVEEQQTAGNDKDEEEEELSDDEND